VSDGGRARTGARRWGEPLKVLDIEDAVCPACDGSGLVPLRPVQHVARRCPPVPADPLAPIDRIRGAAIPVGTGA